MRIHFRATGRVQGVGFRWFVQETAQAAGVTGWVRNVSDGSVEGEAQGPREAVEKFAAEVASGHPWAHVKEMGRSELPERPGEKGFLIESTVR